MPQRRPRSPEPRGSSGRSSCSRSPGSPRDRARDRRLEVRRRRPGSRLDDRADRHARRTRRRRPACDSSGSRKGTYLEVRRGSSTGQVALPGHASSAARREFVDRQALLALGQAPGGVSLHARGQAGVAPGGRQPEGARHADEDGSRHRLEPAARGHRRHGQRARARRANRPERAVSRTRGAAARSRAGADRDRRRRARGARGGAARRRSTTAMPCSSRAGSARRTTTARSSSSRRRSGVGARVDPELEAQIEAVSRAPPRERLQRDYADFAPGVTKQATVPGRRASRSGSPVRRPGCSSRATAGGVVVVLPGPPVGAAAPVAECARDGRRSARCSRARSRPAGASCASSASASRRSRARSRRQAATATASRSTICARDFEIHVDFVVEPGAEARADALEAALRAAARAVAVRTRRARRGGARARALPRARPDARDRGVVHRRARRRAADVGPGLERRRARRRRRVRERGEGARSSACRRS